MNKDQANLIARQYSRSRAELTELGFGNQGYVFTSPWATAIKVLETAEDFERELSVYQRLAEHDIVFVQGLAVPRLLEFDRELRVIEMTMVEPPYLLDFGRAYLDIEEEDFPGPFSDWLEQVEENFGDNFTRAMDVYYYLRDSLGITYYDLAPRNLNFGD